MALVSAVAVLGASVSKSAKQRRQRHHRRLHHHRPELWFSTSVTLLPSRGRGVATVSTVYRGQFELRGSLSSVVGVTAADLPQTVHLAVTSGEGAPACAADELLIDTTTASADHLSVGSVAPVTFAQTGASRIRIGGVFKTNPLIGSYVVGAGFFASHFHSPLPIAVLVRPTPAPATLAPRSTATSTYTPTSGSRPERSSSSHSSTHVNEELGLVPFCWTWRSSSTVGIVNTLMLSVFERPRARSAAGGRDEATAGEDDDPCRGGHRRPVWCADRRGHRDRARRRIRGIAWATGDHRDSRSHRQPSRLPDPLRFPRSRSGRLAGPPCRQLDVLAAIAAE